MKERTGLVKFKENPMTLVGDPIEVGDKAPDFTAVKQDLSEFKLSDLDGKIKIISVVPSLDTGVCQLQTKHFNKEATDLDDSVVMIESDHQLLEPHGAAVISYASSSPSRICYRCHQHQLC